MIWLIDYGDPHNQDILDRALVISDEIDLKAEIEKYVFEIIGPQPSNPLPDACPETLKQWSLEFRLWTKARPRLKFSDFLSYLRKKGVEIREVRVEILHPEMIL